MPFKMVTLSEREVARIAGNAGAHADLIAGDLTARWPEALRKGQKYLDVRQIQLAVRDELRRLRTKIGRVERKHFDRLVSDRLSRQVRDVTIPQLRGHLVGAKSVIDGNFGAGISMKVFGEPEVVIPYEALPLRRLAFNARDNLIDPALVLPKPQLGGVQIVPAELAAGFEPHLFELDRVLLELEDNLPLANATLERKLRTLAELRKRAGVVARFLEALYALAGHEEIAKRVRLSSHRPRSPEDGEADATGEEPGGGAAGETPEDGVEPDAAGAAPEAADSDEEEQVAEAA